MTRPTRYLLLMILCMIAVVALGVVLTPQLSAAYSHNPALNAGIFVVFLIGVVFIFWQVLRLKREIVWIDRFRSGDPTLSTDRGPRLLAPMAAHAARPQGPLQPVGGCRCARCWMASIRASTSPTTFRAISSGCWSSSACSAPSGAC